MIKKLVAATALVATGIVAYCGASLWSGFKIQSQSYAAVDAINLHLARTWPDQVRLSARDYQRGVFSSKASYVLTLPSPKEVDASQKREILFINDITHGPFPLKNLLSGDFTAVGALIETSSAPTPWTEQLLNSNPQQPFVRGHTRVGTNGIASLAWSAEPFQLSQDALRVKFGGAALNAEIGPRFKNRKGTLTLDALNVTDGQATLDLKTVKVLLDARLDSAGLPLGLHAREIAHLTWTSVHAPTIELEKFKFRSALQNHDAEVSGTTDISIGSLSIAQNKLGAFKLALSYDSLSDRSLAPLLELYNRALTRLMINILEPEALSTSEIKKIWVYVQGLLKNNPNIRIEPLVWETTLGKSQLTLNASLNAAELAPGGIGLRESPIDTLDATLTLSQPMVNGLILQSFQNPGTPAAKAKSLAERESRRLTDTAFQLKLGRVQNGRLVSHFNVQDGEFRINGQRTAPEPILKVLGGLFPSKLFASQSSSGQEGPDEAVPLQHLDPAVLGAILSDSDFSYEESRDADGDLVLKVAPGDAGADTIEIIFSGCRKDPTCEDVLLRATYSAQRTAPLKFVNDWNLRNRWARVFVNESGAPVLEMDISAYGGIGQDAIEGMVSTFFKLVRDFSAELKSAEK
jgi:uncharacterized protein YdgA (DUF945 family)